MPSTAATNQNSRRTAAVSAARVLVEDVLARRREAVLADPCEMGRLLGYEVHPFHAKWMELLTGNNRTLLLAPRGHGKSSICGITYAIWKLMNDPNTRILIVSNTLDQARIFVREIRGHIEGNAALRALFGDVRAGKWTDVELLVKRDRIAKEASITAAGASGIVVGRHFDVIIADDIVDEENAWCETQRQKLLTWFHKTLFPCLEPEGALHVIGTRYHGGDLYGELVRRAEAGAPWVIRHDRAIEADTILWPEKFTPECLEEIRKEVGEIVFSCQYLNDPAGGDLGVFKEEWLQFYETLPMEQDAAGGYRTLPLRVYQGVDLAISQRESADFFAVVTIGVDPEHNIYVLDVFQGRITFEKQLQKVRELAARFKPLRIAIEANAYQDVLPSELIRTSGLPVRRVRQTRDKMVRAIRLTPQFENGKVFLKRSMTELTAELLLFPRAAHDDLFDALEMAVNESVGSSLIEAGQY